MTPRCGKLLSCFHQGADLHRVQARLDHTETHASCAEHGVGFLPEFRCLEKFLLGIGEPGGGFLDSHLVRRGQELVQRRVEETDRHRQAVHGGKDLKEVLTLDREQALESSFFFLGGGRQDHLANDRQAVFTEEHVLSTAQANTFCAHLTSIGGIWAIVGIGADLEMPLADGVGPSEDHLKFLWRLP